MALPDLIEIVPLDKPVRAEITVPGSKSITNRALILAALADGEVTLQGALWSEDTQIMVEALQKLGFQIKVEKDPDEFCNRTIMVKGLGGRIPKGGTAEKPLELFVGNAGTAARFLAAFVCLGKGVYRLSGVPRMHERPQKALFDALRQLGCRVDSENGNDKLPAVIFGGRADLPVGRDAQQRVPAKLCTVSIEESSQFASALLLCAKASGWEIKTVDENAKESPYVVMTAKTIEAFPKSGGAFQIEPDASSGSYFLAAGLLNYWKKQAFHIDVFIRNRPESSCQIDAKFPAAFNELSSAPGNVVISRKTDLGDSIMTAIVLSPTFLTPFRKSQYIFTDLGRLRVQESERVTALRKELTKCGANIVEEGDTLTVKLSKSLHGAEIETYDDHRMAMCFAILGLRVPGIKIKNPACVKKTFPNFFQKLATKPPKGLGATILDAKTGRELTVGELFAD